MAAASSFFDWATVLLATPAVLALFRETDATVVAGEDAPERSSLHHLALSLPTAEQAAARTWFEGQQIPCRETIFPWVGWRGLFVQDPDGNTVELVAYDASLLDD
jgi:hypothetical protein